VSTTDVTLESLISRHERFWRHLDTDRPISEIADFVPLKQNPDVPQKGGRVAREGDPIVPDELDLDRMLATWPSPESYERGDYVRERPPYGLCWMEGMMGSGVRAESGSIWAEPPGLDWSRVGEMRARISSDNPWYATLREYYRRLAADTAGRVPLSQPLMRGSIDIVHSLCGSEELALAGHDHPRELEKPVAGARLRPLQKRVPVAADVPGDGIRVFRRARTGRHASVVSSIVSHAFFGLGIWIALWMIPLTSAVV
jgi:hypothetical protein